MIGNDDDDWHGMIVDKHVPFLNSIISNVGHFNMS